jgi:hypothetical protein
LHSKYTNIKDATGREWTHTEIVEYYKIKYVSPLLINLQNKLSLQLIDFEKESGITVSICPILVWEESYREGSKLILKSPLPPVDVHTLLEQLP